MLTFHFSDLLKRYRHPGCTLFFTTGVIQNLINNLGWLPGVDGFGNPHLISLVIGYAPVPLNCTPWARALAGPIGPFPLF